jgi:putative PIN family toxin of toxin-antitoxin system
MQKLRVIFDTNTLISRLLLPKSQTARAVRRLLEIGQQLVSESTLEELAKTLSKDEFDRYVSLADRKDFFQKFARVAEWVEVTTVVRECRDPHDNHFLELAIDGGADLILTGDKDLLAMAPFRGVSILLPAASLAMSDQSIMELRGTDPPRSDAD